MSDILFPNANIDGDLFVIGAWLMEDNWDEAGSNDDIEFGRPLENLDNYINHDSADFAEPQQVPVSRGQIAENDECLGEPQPLLEELQPWNGGFHQSVAVDLPNCPSHVPFELAPQQHSVFNAQQFQAPMGQLMDQRNFQAPIDQPLMAYGNFQGPVNQPMAQGNYQVLMAQPNYNRDGADFSEPQQVPVTRGQIAGNDECLGEPQPLLEELQPWNGGFHQSVSVDHPNFPSHVPFELAPQQHSVFNAQQFQAPMDQLMDQGNFQAPIDQPLMAHGNFQAPVNQPMAHGNYQVLMAQPNYNAPLAPAILPRPEAVIIVHKKSGNNCRGRPRASENRQNNYMRDYHLKKQGKTILRMLRAINSQEELDKQVDLLNEENIFVSFEDHPVHPVLNFDEDSTEVNVNHLQP